jgi:hypothetical protein
VIDRLPGVRSAALFGRRAVEPIRASGETWEECFWRTCVKEAPDWIVPRAQSAIEARIRRHAGHTTAPLPQAENCERCMPIGSWEAVAKSIYMGDPFSLHNRHLPYVEPDHFRPGSGTWGKGNPTF